MPSYKDLKELKEVALKLPPIPMRDKEGKMITTPVPMTAEAILTIMPDAKVEIGRVYKTMQPVFVNHYDMLKKVFDVAGIDGVRDYATRCVEEIKKAMANAPKQEVQPLEEILPEGVEMNQEAKIVPFSPTPKPDTNIN
jgi:hypothetical protein